MRQSLRTRDHRVALERAAQILAREQRCQLGIEDPLQQQLARPIAEHLAEFEAVLVSKGVTQDHRKDRMKSLHDFVRDGRVHRLGDLDPARASRWLNVQRERLKLSARSVNRRCQALRQFGRWLATCRRLAYDPFASLALLNERVDRRHVRRALTLDEFAKLLVATLSRPLEDARRIRKNKGVATEDARRLMLLGETRALAYVLAATTGLRRQELAGLRWTEVDLEQGVATVAAERAKARVEQRVLLHSVVVERLRSIRPAGFGPEDRVIPPALFPNLRTFKKDLAVAGIPLRDVAGRVVDFHALRGTLVTWLQASGSMPRVAQAIARHAKLETTMRHYVDDSLLDLRGALERLPLPPAAGHGAA